MKSGRVMSSSQPPPPPPQRQQQQQQQQQSVRKSHHIVMSPSLGQRVRLALRGFLRSTQGLLLNYSTDRKGGQDRLTGGAIQNNFSSSSVAPVHLSYYQSIFVTWRKTWVSNILKELPVILLDYLGVGLILLNLILVYNLFSLKEIDSSFDFKFSPPIIKSNHTFYFFLITSTGAASIVISYFIVVLIHFIRRSSSSSSSSSSSVDQDGSLIPFFFRYPSNLIFTFGMRGLYFLCCYKFLHLHYKAQQHFFTVGGEDPPLLLRDSFVVNLLGVTSLLVTFLYLYTVGWITSSCRHGFDHISWDHVDGFCATCAALLSVLLVSSFPHIFSGVLIFLLTLFRRIYFPNCYSYCSFYKGRCLTHDDTFLTQCATQRSVAGASAKGSFHSDQGGRTDPLAHASSPLESHGEIRKYIQEGTNIGQFLLSLDDRDTTAKIASEARQASDQRLVGARTVHDIGEETSLNLHSVINNWTIVGNWNADLFAINDSSRGHPILAVMLDINRRYDLATSLGCDPIVFMRFMRLVESRHMNVPYHNSLHGADVANSSFWLFEAAGWLDQVSPLEFSTFLLASACHDVGHAGFSNEYLINSQSQLATIFNDSSVLENFHSALTFELLTFPNCDVFANLNKAEKKLSRKLVIESILATDMKRHFNNISELQLSLNKWEKGWGDSRNLWTTEWDRRVLIYKLFIKVADIGHPGKSRGLHLKWCKLFVEECHQQGDVEKAKCLPVTPLCDRARQTTGQDQIGFLKAICRPMYSLAADITKSERIYKDIIKQVDSNIEYWKWHSFCNEPVKLAEAKIQSTGETENAKAQENPEDYLSKTVNLTGDNKRVAGSVPPHLEDSPLARTISLTSAFGESLGDLASGALAAQGGVVGKEWDKLKVGVLSSRVAGAERLLEGDQTSKGLLWGGECCRNNNRSPPRPLRANIAGPTRIEMADPAGGSANERRGCGSYVLSPIAENE